MNKLNQKGFGLIEIIIAAAIGIAVLLTAAAYLNFSLKIAAEDINQIEALYYAKSSLEQARAVRDENWENINALIIGSAYHFEADSSIPQKWIPVSGNTVVGRYIIQIVSSNVYRDAASNNIVSSGGVLDSETLKITSNVFYPVRSGLKQIEIYEYLTNFK
jgi:type II secretory pathway pseudopilin PulG